MYKFRKVAFLLVAIIFSATPLISSAAGLVPCGNDNNPCTLCHLIVGIHGLVSYGMQLITIAAIVGIFCAGVMYVISAGDEGMMTSAKGFMKSSLLGFLFVFGGWLIINVTMLVLGAKTAEDEGGVLGINIVSWNKFDCSASSTAGKGK